LKSAEFIGWALGGLEREIAQTRDRLAALTAQAARLRERVGRGRQAALAAGGLPPDTSAPVKKRRKMSKEARRRISEAAKKRWAERRKAEQKKRTA
jgi:hypothetical protein